MMIKRTLFFLLVITSSFGLLSANNTGQYHQTIYNIEGKVLEEWAFDKEGSSYLVRDGKGNILRKGKRSGKGVPFSVQVTQGVFK